MRKERILWNNINVNEEDYIDVINDWLASIEREEENFETISDYEKWDFIDSELQLDFAFLKQELSSLQLDNPILVIADLGFWDGRKQGYKIIDSCQLEDILSTSCDYCKWYSDGYNIRFEGHHHDGSDHYEFREIKNMDNIDKLLDKIVAGEKISRNTLNYYTKSLLPIIKKHFGW